MVLDIRIASLFFSLYIEGKKRQSLFIENSYECVS